MTRDERKKAAELTAALFQHVRETGERDGAAMAARELDWLGLRWEARADSMRIDARLHKEEPGFETELCVRDMRELADRLRGVPLPALPAKDGPPPRPQNACPLCAGMGIPNASGIYECGRCGAMFAA